MRRSLLFVSVIGLALLTGCASPTPGAADTTTHAADPNAEACSELEALWDQVEDWGTTPGNTEGDGNPAAGATAPDFRLKLDAIRQTTDGPLRTALDEYFESAPTMGIWWYANGIHRYGYAHSVGSACEAEGAPVDLR